MLELPTSRLPPLPRNKYLCPTHLSVHQFVGCIRKKAQMPKDVALFVFINGNELVTATSSMSELYELRKEEDGFLYVQLSDQEVMG